MVQGEIRHLSSDCAQDLLLSSSGFYTFLETPLAEISLSFIFPYNCSCSKLSPLVLQASKTVGCPLECLEWCRLVPVLRITAIEKRNSALFSSFKTLFGVCICVCVCVVTSCPILCDLMDLSPPIGLLCWWRSPGKNTGMGCQAFFQGISLTQGLNLNLLSPALAVWFFTTRATWGWKPNSLLLSVYFITLWCLHRGPLAPGFRLLYSERLFW